MERTDATDPKTLRYKFRKKRFQRIEAMITMRLETQDSVTILDIGGRRNYWHNLSEDLRSKVFITLVNFEEELTEYSEKSDTLNLTSIIGDGCAMPQFEDNSFDIAHSNSVIEHVGSLVKMGDFAAETRRIGKSYYIQAPYLWFPIDPHFGIPLIHWLPCPSRAYMMHKFKLGFSDTPIPDYKEALSEADHIRLVDKTLMNNLFPDAEMFKERFCLLAKSLIMVKDELA